jgi:hypothetical protein
MVRGFPFKMALDVWNPRSNIRRALMGSELAHDERCIYPRNIEIPAGGGVGTARGIAQAYSVFANGGKELGLRKETMQELTAPAVPARHGFFDECIRSDVRFSLGFMRPNSGFPFGRRKRIWTCRRRTALLIPKLRSDMRMCRTGKAQQWEGAREMWR